MRASMLALCAFLLTPFITFWPPGRRRPAEPFVGSVAQAACPREKDSPPRSFTVAYASEARLGVLELVVNPKEPLATAGQRLEIICRLREFDLRELPREGRRSDRLEDYMVVVMFYRTRSRPAKPFLHDDPDLLAVIRWIPRMGLVSQWVKGREEIKADWVPAPCGQADPGEEGDGATPG